jgi:hypothetical protein
MMNEKIGEMMEEKMDKEEMEEAPGIENEPALVASRRQGRKGEKIGEIMEGKMEEAPGSENEPALVASRARDGKAVDGRGHRTPSRDRKDPTRDVRVDTWSGKY